ncbi:MAG: trypsin-like peptidase domain-containing protein [Clostridia bacterium]|nr:trypsin-like peptidase domain-containing protein [Clostridia bacterium]
MGKISKYLCMALMVMIIPCCAMLAGCGSQPVSIVSIEKTDTVGLVDTYTISYSDGTTSTFTVTNGKDGSDGKDGKDGSSSVVSITEVYEKYKTETGNNISYEEFLNEYLVLNDDSTCKVINKCLLSSVKLYVESYQTTTDFWGNETKSTAMSAGSGVIYEIRDDYTYVVTNYHVVYNHNANADNGSKIGRAYGYLYGSESVPVKDTQNSTSTYTAYDYGKLGIAFEYIGGSLEKDIAVLRVQTSKIKAINDGIKAVTLADDYYVGETAIAIGNPDADGISVTEGIVSVDNEYINLALDNQARAYRSIRIDTAIYQGSSGGGLFNARGELIGITNAGDGDDQNVNFAIPLQVVAGTADNIISYYNDNNETFGVYKIKLGVEVETTNSKYVYDSNTGLGEIVETLKVTNVEENSITDLMELEVGDIIKGFVINNEVYDINRTFEIGDKLVEVRAGDEIKIVYARAGADPVQSAAYTILATDLISVA